MLGSTLVLTVAVGVGAVVGAEVVLGDELVGLGADAAGLSSPPQAVSNNEAASGMASRAVVVLFTVLPTSSS
jgi:hypothetical protein